MRKAVCPGSFDPVTMGHLDIFERASKMFDELIVSVFVNPAKDKAMFSMEERVAMIEKATAHIPNIRVTSFSGLLNEFCEQEGAKFIVRGLRAFTDFEYEFQRALLMKEIDKNLETVFIMTSEEYGYVSSTIVRQIATLGGDVSKLLPPSIYSRLRKKLAKEPHQAINDLPE